MMISNYIRASFSNWTAEETVYLNVICEMALTATKQHINQTSVSKFIRVNNSKVRLGHLIVNGWILDHWLGHSEAIRDWKPWKLSTDAWIDEGKDISKINALRHWYFSVEEKSYCDFVLKF